MKVVFAHVGHNLTETHDVLKIGIVPCHNVSVEYDLLERAAPLPFDVKDLSIRIVLK
jgi:hypothetical protein